MIPIQDPVERFVSLMSDERWTINGPDTWREDYTQGIPVEMMLPRSHGELFIIYTPGESHISVTVVDENAKEYIEFGFDFDNPDELEDALKALVAVQKEVIPKSIARLLRVLLSLSLRLSWEHQGQELDPVTLENVDSTRYRFPLLS